MIENKGRGYEKKVQESLRAGKRKKVKEVRHPAKFVRDGEGRNW
jgi:hypothetical protein